MPNLARPLLVWTAAAIGAAAAVGFGLAAALRLGPTGLAVAAAVTALVTLAVVAIASRLTEADPAPSAELVRQASPPEPTGSLVAALDVHPDPLAVIEGGVRGPRIVYANYAARDRLQLRVDAPLVASVRHPRVLDRLERALEHGAAGSTLYQPAGDERTWRALTVGLPPGAAGQQRALLAFRDETDARAGQRSGADFLANASHELRTPLASLSGFIETLRGHARDDPEARDRFLEIMAGQAARMGRLVDDLLSLSRIEMNEHVPPTGTVDLALVAGDVVDALAPVASARNVTVERRAPAAGVVLLDGDRDQMLQVVQNLLDNAIRYSAAGSTVRVSVEAASDMDRALVADLAGAAHMTLAAPARPMSGAVAVLKVSDAGPGIAREHLPRLGERFYRVDEGGARGTGLGLAIVRHVVARHRGTLTVQSLPGLGAVFTAAFPARPPEPAPTL